LSHSPSQGRRYKTCYFCPAGSPDRPPLRAQKA